MCEMSIVILPQNASVERVVSRSIVCPVACVGTVMCCEMSAAFGMSEKCFVSEID